MFPDQPQHTQKKNLERLFITAVLVNLFFLNVPVLKTIGHIYSTVVHELGHTFFFWLFGEFAIPTFSFFDGRGLTLPFGHSIIFSGILLLGMTFSLYRWFRINQDSLSLNILALFIIYLIIFFSPKLRNNLIGFMGQGGEVLGAFCCCYLGLTPYSSRPRHEKNTLFILGSFLFVNSFAFAYKLNFDALFSWLYQHPLNEGVANDFITISKSMGISITWLTALLTLFNIATLIFLFFCLFHYPYNIFVRIYTNVKIIFFLEPEKKYENEYDETE